MSYNGSDRNLSAWNDAGTTACYMEDYSLQRSERYLFARYLKPGCKILDIGCGGCRTTINLYERGFDVVAIDYSHEMVQRAGSRFPYLDIRAGDARGLEFGDATFDAVIFSYNGMDYITDARERQGAVGEIRRVLSDDGVFIYSSHNIKAFLFQFLFQGRKGHNARNILRSFGDFAVTYERIHAGLYTCYTSAGYNEAMMSQNGFEIMERCGNKTLSLLEKKRVRLDIFKENYIDPWVYYAARVVSSRT